MKRVIPAALAVFVGWIIIGSYHGHGQRPGSKRVRGLNPRTADEVVARQAEVQRLQKLIDGMESRLRRLERRASSSDAIPPFTIDESKAALALATKQVDATTEGLADGTATELDVARDRLSLSRARSQLMIAEAAYADRELALESDVAYAMRDLVQWQRQQTQLQRLVAKGYSSAEGLELVNLDVDLAKKQLARAQARLKLHEKLAGANGDPPAESGSASPAPPADDL